MGVSAELIDCEPAHSTPLEQLHEQISSNAPSGAAESAVVTTPSLVTTGRFCSDAILSTKRPRERFPTGRGTGRFCSPPGGALSSAALERPKRPPQWPRTTPNRLPAPPSGLWRADASSCACPRTQGTAETPSERTGTRWRRHPETTRTRGRPTRERRQRRRGQRQATRRARPWRPPGWAVKQTTRQRMIPLVQADVEGRRRKCGCFAHCL